jgi:hypothetical protein
MDQIQYRSGQMLNFVATRGFALGSTGLQISRGMEVQFDGTKVVVDGAEVSMPQLRGAIRSGWLVLAEAFDQARPEDRPESAQIQVRHPTQGGNPFMNQTPTKKVAVIAETDERQVGNTASHAAAARTSNANYRQGKGVRNEVGGSVDSQDGVPVRSLKTAAGERAKQARTVLTAESLGSEIRKAENVQIEAGEGLSEAAYLDRMSEQERSEYLAKKEVARARHVDIDVAPAVGKVRKARQETREGITATVTTGGGIETADPIDTGSKTEISQHLEDGIVFRNTNGPKKQVAEPHPRSEESQQPVMLRDGTAEARLKIARQLCKDFPANYDFAAPERKKLARIAADYEDREDILRAIWAAESDSFKAKLFEEFPAIFG